MAAAQPGQPSTAGRPAPGPLTRRAYQSRVREPAFWVAGDASLIVGLGAQIMSFCASHARICRIAGVAILHHCPLNRISGDL